jgi:hypothetical protein
MWEVVYVTMCLGVPAPDYSNCQRFTDNWGPYESEARCELRVDEMIESMAPAFALSHGYFGPVAILTPEQKCHIPSTEDEVNV